MSIITGVVTETISVSKLFSYSRVIVIAILIMHVVLVSGYGHGGGRTTGDSFVL